MSIGYVSIILSEPDIKMKSCILKNASSEHLSVLIEHNLSTLDQMLEFNCKHDIRLFRLSSGFIPFASHPINKLRWWQKYSKQFLALGDKAKRYKIRLSFHPGQYTTLSSPNEEIVKKSIKDLQYHARVLDAMGLDSSSKMILHIGGGYGDKPTAMERFIKNYSKLPQNIKNRLVIENDDKIYTATEVLYISKRTGAPVIFDYLHHLLNHEGELDTANILQQVRKTWRKEDGVQKIHYSQQAKGKRAGSHSQTIEVPEFVDFYKTLPQPIDVMLEVKDKDLSALKCITELKKQKIEN